MANEMQIQALLMRWTLDVWNHVLAIPNPTRIFRWECDLLTLTRAGLSHEFEIKLVTYTYAGAGKTAKAK